MKYENSVKENSLLYEVRRIIMRGGGAGQGYANDEPTFSSYSHSTTKSINFSVWPPHIKTHNNKKATTLWLVSMAIWILHKVWTNDHIIPLWKLNGEKNWK